MVSPRLATLRENMFTVLVAEFFVLFAYRFSRDYLYTGRVSSLLFLIFESVNLFITIIRRKPKQVSLRLKDWVYAITGSLLPTIFFIVPEHPVAFWLVVQVFGSIISFSGMLSLNRSFGVVPANRGVQTQGIYQYIRHPLYSGYVFTNMAVVAQNFCLMNVAIFAIWMVAQWLRIEREEVILLQDEAYKVYRQKVPWRIIPKLW